MRAPPLRREVRRAVRANPGRAPLPRERHPRVPLLAHLDVVAQAETCTPLRTRRPVLAVFSAHHFLRPAFQNRRLSKEGVVSDSRCTRPSPASRHLPTSVDALILDSSLPIVSSSSLYPNV